MATLSFSTASIAAARAVMLFFMQGQALPPAPLPLWDPNIPVSDRHEGVFLSRDGHEVFVVLPSGVGASGNHGVAAWKVTQVPLWNNVAPTVSTSIEPKLGGEIRYRYNLKNEMTAQDAIGSWSLVVPGELASVGAIESPNDSGRKWVGSAATAIVARQSALDPASVGRYLLWFHHQPGSAVRPGNELGGFAVTSRYLPGFTTAWFSSGKLVEFDQSWPQSIFRKLELLEGREWRERSLLVVGPCFAPDAQRAMISENIHLGIQRLSEGGRIDKASPFVSKLTALLNSDDAQSRQSYVSASPASKEEELLARVTELSLGVHR